MNERHILVANVFFAPFSYGGATVVAEQVAQALIAQGGYRVTAVSLCARLDLSPYAVIKSQKNGIANYLINVPERRSYAEMYNNPEITARLAELISALEPDLVHAHCIQEIGTGVVTAAEACAVPVVLSVHDFWWLCERQFMVRIDERYCGQNPVSIEKCKGCAENYWAAKTRFDHLQQIGAKVALVTYPSMFARDLSEASGFAPGRGAVWTNGVRLPGKSFWAKQERRRRRDGRVSFGYIGGPSHIKGWTHVQQAFRQIGRADFRGLVVDGGLEDAWWDPSDLRKMRGEWTIHPRFTQETMDEFYAEIDVLLFMSQWKETFGLAIREALSRGIRVIQTDSGGTVEHAAVAPDDLIPIGAPSKTLRARIDDVLKSGQREHPVWPVSSFADQASAFSGFLDEFFDQLDRAA